MNKTFQQQCKEMNEAFNQLGLSIFHALKLDKFCGWLNKILNKWSKK